MVYGFRKSQFLLWDGVGLQLQVDMMVEVVVESIQRGKKEVYIWMQYVVLVVKVQWYLFQVYVIIGKLKSLEIQCIEEDIMYKFIFIWLLEVKC